MSSDLRQASDCSTKVLINTPGVATGSLLNKLEKLVLQGTPIAGWVFLDTSLSICNHGPPLITGGAGFIVYTCVVLLRTTMTVVLDSFANSSPLALDQWQSWPTDLCSW